MPFPAALEATHNCFHQATQWEDLTLIDHGYPVIPGKLKKDQAIQCYLAGDETVTSRLIKTDSDSNLYVGLPRHIFLTIVKSMTPFAQKGWVMAVEDQLLMTLMKLKLNLLGQDLARRFCVSTALVSKMLKYWLKKLADNLSSLIVWLPRDTIRATLPSVFRLYPKTTCILDCAETLLQKSSNLQSRGESYSNYKSHNTVKYCVAVAPSGYIMHISRGYGGRASDKFIVQNSGLLQRLCCGDEVMADRGFTISDLLYPLQVKLNIPAFSQGKQLSEEDVTETRRIAQVRIHVERAIRRLKVYRILKETVPISLVKQVDYILRICAALVNLRGTLILEQKEKD